MTQDTLARRARPEAAADRASASRWTTRPGVAAGSLLIVDSLAVAFPIAILIAPPLGDLRGQDAVGVLTIVGQALASTHAHAFFTSMTLWVIAFLLSGIHTRRRLITPFRHPLKFITLALIVYGLFAFAATTGTLGNLPDPYRATIPGLCLVAAVHMIWRLFENFLESRQPKGLLFAPHSSAAPMEALLKQNERALNIRLVGLLDWDDHFPLTPGYLSEHIDEILNAMRDCGATVLLLTTTTIPDFTDLQDFRWQLENEGMNLDLVMEPADFAPDLIEVVTAPGLAIARTEARRDSLVESILHRLFDIAVSSLLILMLSPLWIILYFLIRHEDGGPAFFFQQRVGRGGATFPMVKFRTMAVDAEARLQELREKERALRAGRTGDEDDPDTGILFKLKDDPRVTKIGRFLRRTSIDELPQLFNVWWGHMSLVGPRPPLPREVALYEPRVMRKFNVRPGMTGLWQVSGRSNLSWPEAIRLDLHYVEHRSFSFDLWILMQTVRVVLRQDGAY
ncbi:MAG: exopolysaccharide biosynthesis polyprenyl glycosylphosphotransferase [Actinomycetaceae bacterium]|nr:exopolysaccharide biosynthesis polyprenyl glycosylphosphotransferase [Actinomycetaceae bacterium]